MAAAPWGLRCNPNGGETTYLSTNAIDSASLNMTSDHIQGARSYACQNSLTKSLAWLSSLITAGKFILFMMPSLVDNPLTARKCSGGVRGPILLTACCRRCSVPAGNLANTHRSPATERVSGVVAHAVFGDPCIVVAPNLCDSIRETMEILKRCRCCVLYLSLY